MSRPLVSIIVPTYNRSAYLQAALASLFQQTLTDFEIIVIDDGSSDDTSELLGRIGDARLKVVTHASNRGIAAARNSGLDSAAGKYIAWLDSDDVCRRTRLAKQVRFLEEHSEIALVGGCAGKIDQNGRPIAGIRVPPFDPPAVRSWLIFKSAFQQSSVMGRAQILKRTGYDPSFLVCEDIDVFARLARGHLLANMPSVLVDRRIHDGQVSRERRRLVLTSQARISAPQLAAMGVEFTDEDLLRHAALARVPAGPVTREDVAWDEAWLSRLVDANRRRPLVDDGALGFAAKFLRFQLHRRLGEGVFRSAFSSRIVTAQGASWAARATPIAVAQELAVQTLA